MTPDAATAVGASLVVAFTWGRLSAHRTIRHLRDQVDWRTTLENPTVLTPQDDPTPTTATGVQVYDGLSPMEAVAMAWVYPGRKPDWHARKVAEVRRGMPVLARNLDRLVAELRAQGWGR